MNKKRFTNRAFRFCNSCRAKQQIVIQERGNLKLGVYNCSKCKADAINSYVLVEYYDGGCRIKAKKMKAYELFIKS